MRWFSLLAVTVGIILICNAILGTPSNMILFWAELILGIIIGTIGIFIKVAS
jgi:hypothetical protein